MVNRTIQSANALILQIDVLTMPHYFCDEYKKVLKAKVEYVLFGKNHIVTNFGNELSSIASSCDLDYGIPVYEAQSLCKQLDLTYSESDCSVSNRSIEKKKEISNEFIIAPNPTSGLINISANKAIILVEILTLDGRIVKTNQYNDKDLLQDLRIFDDGVYLLRIVTLDGQSTVHKIIIAK